MCTFYWFCFSRDSWLIQSGLHCPRLDCNLLKGGGGVFSMPCAQPHAPSPRGLPPGPALSSSEQSRLLAWIWRAHIGSAVWCSLFQTADHKFTPAKGHPIHQLSRVHGEEKFESEKCQEWNDGPGPAGGPEGSARLSWAEKGSPTWENRDYDPDGS